MAILLLPSPSPAASFPRLAALASFLLLIWADAPVLCKSLPVKPLALKCGPSRLQAVDPHLTRSLLGALASEAFHVGFAASSVSANRGGDRLHGLTQCRPDVMPQECMACLSAAADAVVFSLCMGSSAAAGWFVDGCYLHYYYGSREDFLREVRPFNASSRSGSYAHDQADFSLAATQLLRRLVAEAGLPSHRGFSHGEASYGDSGSRVYAAMECLRSIPPDSCSTCLEVAAAAILTCCGKMEGGLSVAGDCAIRFESRRFLYSHPRRDAPTSLAPSPSVAITTYDEDGEGDVSTSLKRKLLLLSWLVAVACLAGFAMGMCQMRRRILPVKVAAATSPGIWK